MTGPVNVVLVCPHCLEEFPVGQKGSVDRCQAHIMDHLLELEVEEPD